MLYGMWLIFSILCRSKARWNNCINRGYLFCGFINYQKNNKEVEEYNMASPEDEDEEGYVVPRRGEDGEWII